MTKTKILRNLFIDQLKDLYDAENHTLKTLTKLAKTASSDELRAGFEEHLQQTTDHAARIKQILGDLGEKAGGGKCPAMAGLIEESDDIMGENYEDSVMDAALISAAQRIEHYEIGAYGCLRAWAELLGEREAEQLLERTLTEEEEREAKLTRLSEQINQQALSESEMVEETLTQTSKGNGKVRGANA